MKAENKTSRVVDVRRKADQANVQATSGVRGPAAIDSVRMKKAAEGVMKRGAAQVIAYFERNVANPFPNDGWTMDIHIANVPEWFALTALGKELRAAATDESRLEALTKPLQSALLDRDYRATFSIGAGEESGTTLRVRLQMSPGSA